MVCDAFVIYLAVLSPPRVSYIYIFAFLRSMRRFPLSGVATPTCGRRGDEITT